MCELLELKGDDGNEVILGLPPNVGFDISFKFVMAKMSITFLPHTPGNVVRAEASHKGEKRSTRQFGDINQISFWEYDSRNSLLTIRFYIVSSENFHTLPIL